MTKQIDLIDRGDAYEIHINVDTHAIQVIWEYLGNESTRPRAVQFEDLNPELQRRIESKIAHG